MTDHLDKTARKDLIEYKFEKSFRSLDEARVLAESDYYNAAVNRLYYAAYYAASALMLEASLETVTHKGIKTMLGLRFIRAGILEVEYGQIYQQLFDGRQAGDYEDFVYHDKEMYESLAPRAEKFIKRIREIVEES